MSEPNEKQTFELNEDRAQEIYAFQDTIQQLLFSKMIHELRCSVCQNQNLTDSMAPLAVSLRQEIYQKVRSGFSENDIIEFVSSRYGEFVLYRPPLNNSTFFLWFGPLMMLLVGVLFFRRYLK